jgi:hypothetical protein
MQQLLWPLDWQIPSEASTGVLSASESIEIGTGTWEVHILPREKWVFNVQVLKAQGEEEGVWMAESAIVVRKWVMTTERRAGR